jgi:hypothetical protein
MDLTGSLLYFGSPSDAERIVADHEAQPHDFTSTLRKQIL